MGEFQEKVDQFKQTVLESGFQTQEAEDTSSDANYEPPINSSPEANNGDFVADEPMGAAPPEPQRIRKKTNTFKKRIDQLTYENRIKDQQLYELAHRAQEQERLLADTSARLEQNEHHKNAYYENNLQTREASIISELKAAKEEGDFDKEIALSRALAQVTAEQSTYGLYKNQIAGRQPQAPQHFDNDYYPQPTIREPEYPVSNYGDEGEFENEELESWLDANPWADAQSQQYSPRLRSEVEQLATELDETLKYNGQGALIGTREYFNSLNNLMSDRYGVNKLQPQQYEEPQYQQPQRPSYQGVAPVNRRGSSMADQYMSRNPNTTRGVAKLTDEQYKIARNLQIKTPTGWKSGNDVVNMYAQNAQMGSRNGSNKLVID